jgi:phosphoribosylpyrophosphate synthetase
MFIAIGHRRTKLVHPAESDIELLESVRDQDVYIVQSACKYVICTDWT